MKTQWLIDDYMIQTSYHEDMREVLKRNNFEFDVQKYIPFSDKKESSLSKDNCVVIYGSIGFVKQNLTSGFIPGAYLEEKSMSLLGYMPLIDDTELLANSNHVLTTFQDLKNRKQFFYNIFNTNKIFIRPNCGLKTFTGLPIHEDDFNHEINSIESLSSAEKDTLILVSDCKKITHEYRFFIVNREVITGSQYKFNDEINVKKGYSEEAFFVADKMAKNIWQPDLAYVCDVGIVNGVPKIIELNSFSCSGFYACDIDKIVNAVDLIAIKEYNGEISIGDI